MRRLTVFEALFGFIDITSAIFCGLALLFIYRKTGSGGLKGMNEVDKLMFIILKTQYSANLIYHLSLISAYYPDILVFDGQWTNWETEKIYAWPQFSIYLTLSTLVYCSAIWLILFWSKLKTDHFLTPLNFILDMASQSSLVRKIWLTLIVGNFIGHFAIIGIAVALPRAPPNVSAPDGFDGRKLLLLCNIPMCVALAFLVLVMIPVFIDLIGVIFMAARSKVSKGKWQIIGISLKIIVVIVFGSGAAALALSGGMVDILSSIDRICGNISPYDESAEFGANQIRRAYGISVTRFFYGFCGIITSVPYVFRKDFYRIAIKGDMSESFNSTSMNSERCKQSKSVDPNSVVMSPTSP